ncbi:MAG: hypothetical protein K6E29_05100 [Cyanobacteria bacterium RUI128]|nr:hypothetical protein [Cyanobacteria bacterium RUI128]
MQISLFTPNKTNFSGQIHCKVAAISKPDSEYITQKENVFINSESISSISEHDKYESEIRMNNGDVFYTNYSPEQVAKAKSNVDGTNQISGIIKNY